MSSYHTLFSGGDSKCNIVMLCHTGNSCPGLFFLLLVCLCTDDKSGLSDHSSDQVIPFKASVESRESGGKATAATARLQPASGKAGDQLSGGEEDYYSSDGTLTGSELGSKDSKPITSHKEQQPANKQVCRNNPWVSLSWDKI